MIISLSLITSVEVIELADSAEGPVARPGDEWQPIQVASRRPRRGRKYVEIVDGYHRTAAIVRWARKNDMDLSEVHIDVIVV